MFVGPCFSGSMREQDTSTRKSRVTMRYGVPSVINPVNTMIIIIGFWNMPNRLNDSRALK